MGLGNWWFHHEMKSEARRVAKRAADLYAEVKAGHPSATEREVILRMYIDPNKLASWPEETRRKLEVCCETVQGLCYIMSLDAGRLHTFSNFRGVQFTYYMDKELKAVGFPSQSQEQKRRIMAAMKRDIRGWEDIIAAERKSDRP